ncbi:MAG TPA: proprotein convertase P-domain-containing protein, partial [Saprospiraceae bacterium]|nr:proprotein convertase P-domain-containing protein [Saprospiraceae bacterium]
MAQCGINDTFRIPDATTTQHFIEVSGALNNDLSSAQQGICRVNISFKHPHVGDLRIRLLSPGGQAIVLVGNIGNSYNTTGSFWNVHFVPQSSPSAPDIGIFPIWSNTSNWQAGTSYTG